MALNIPLPRQILTHAHWTLGREKMSKSTGNVVNPFFALDRFGVDTMRFFLALRGGIKDDAIYDNSLIIELYKSHLQDMLGNLSSRLVRGKGWNIRRAVQCHLMSKSEVFRLHWTMLDDLPSIVAKQIEEELDCGAALETIVKAVRSVRSSCLRLTLLQCCTKKNLTHIRRHIDEPIHARLLTVENREGWCYHGRTTETIGRDHLRMRRVSPDLRHPAATLYAVEGEAFARPARRRPERAHVQQRHGHE